MADEQAQQFDALLAEDRVFEPSEAFMRRLLRHIADRKALGDVTTLADPTVVAKLREKYEDQEG